MWGYNFGWGGMSLMMVGMTLWIALLVIMSWAIVTWLNNRTTNPARQTQTLPGSGSTAREILSQRYAGGEIDTTTFEQMQERLDASENAHQRSRTEGVSMIHRSPSRQTIGERLFD